MTADSRPERALLATLLAVAVGLACLDGFSETALQSRSGRPLAAWLRLGPSELYLLLYSWERRTLELVRVPPDTAMEDVEPPQLGRIGLRIRWGPSAGTAPPGDPESAKAWITSWPRDIRFWLRWPRVLRKLHRSDRGTLPAYDAALLALEAYRLEPEAIHPAWASSRQELFRLLDQILKNDRRPDPRRPVTVEIFNASGEPRVALQATKVLRWRGLDVVDFGNASDISETTRFFDRSGIYEAAGSVAQALGCDAPEISTRLDPARRAMVTAILGKDFRRCAGLGGAARKTSVSVKEQELWNW